MDLPGSERVVPQVTYCTMNGKGHGTGAPRFPVLFGVTAGSLMLPSFTLKQPQYD